MKLKISVFGIIPGKNDEVSYMSMQYISFFKGLTRHFILVTHTLKEDSSMMKLLDSIALDYDIVVNKMGHVKFPQLFPDWVKMVDH
jgi:GTP-binding protein EngB required for normal cell division